MKTTLAVQSENTDTMKVQSTSPMVVVANRLPFSLGTNPETGALVRKQCAGGLVTAVAPVVVETEGLWVGWSGLHLEDNNLEIPESDPNDQSPTAGLKSSQVIPVTVPKKQFDDYYNGCCNATFWPLFHSMPDRATFQADKWEAYRQVNAEFARMTVEAVKRLHNQNPGSVPLVWLHDYHMMLAANTIREKCDELNLPIKMAFFLHIPFPSWDIVRLFPWDDELLQGILGCDSIGFHIEDYCLNFIDCCQRRLGCRVDRQQMLVEHNSRTVSINPLPISIPYDRFVELAKKAPQVVKKNPQEQMLLGVDRLDYTKGLVHKIKAFKTLLQKHPQFIEHVTFLQVAVPSRTDVKEYQELKEELDQLIGRINGQFSTPNWSPIRYIYGCVSQDQLAAFYRDSSVAIVTPLRDGMNLVAKEFVACQTGEPGVLLLSPFAGAGITMHEALLINPYETNEFADTIYRALTMPKDEREMRMKQLRRREREHDVNFWLRNFLKTVDCLSDDERSLPAGRLLPLTEEDFSHYLGPYVTESTRLALLLDYDGTLAPIAPHPDLAQMPPETRRVLERLSHMPDVNIAIISGRSLENVRSMVGIEGITYAGNHGFEIIHPDGTMFMHPVPHEFQVQLETLKQRLEEVCVDGAWLENKGSCITFHYREVPKEKEAAITNRAQELFKEVGIKIHHSHRAYEAQPAVTWNKGRAALYILRTLFGLDWCDRVSTIFAGDDKTDEDAMRALKGMAITFRITNSQNLRTTATHRLPSTDAIHSMLKWIERRLSSRLPLCNNGIRSRTASVSSTGNKSPTHTPTPSSPQFKSRINSVNTALEPNKQVMMVNDEVYQQYLAKRHIPRTSSTSPSSSPTRSTV